ncbi:P-type conjugative transfer protein TrbJ [Sphingobium boeckii]|uniref:P-type conjugative transfer protein TrbJ n=1 Tax=Sphingobium boeckii TaxID=1082345 RepID=A0A7W9AG01_9SPHN|nr:P-type conjugative transfer protein TrbJ [Sphingobium boeckii]MBB5684982.1 P-type conjugative transfer protein TrbJ [Sphingobium boeckii]
MRPCFLSASVLRVAAIGAAAVTALVPSSPSLAIPVFDTANYTQNLLTAARTLQQINQQIQSLQNEAAMLTQMGKHLQKIDFPQLHAMSETLAQVDQLMAQAQGIGFRVDGLDTQFRSLYPDTFDQSLRLDRRVADARARLDAAMAGFRQTMTVQAKVAESVQADGETLLDLVAKSQGAVGSLHAQQATNQLLALAAKQQFQLQNLMAAQYRSETSEMARRVQAEREARAATKTFLGSGKAYEPR